MRATTAAAAAAQLGAGDPALRLKAAEMAELTGERNVTQFCPEQQGVLPSLISWQPQIDTVKATAPGASESARGF